MPPPTPLDTRLRVLRLHRDGHADAAIARELGLNPRTVATLLRRVADHGDDGLQPRYDRCGPRGPRAHPLLQRAALTLKRRHPTWGAPLIHLLLSERYGDRFSGRIPAVRTLQLWFRRAGLTRPRSRPPKPERRWASAPHDVWQADAKEHQRTADGADACWLTVTDERSGAILAAPVFPLRPDLAGPPA